MYLFVYFVLYLILLGFYFKLYKCIYKTVSFEFFIYLFCMIVIYKYLS